MPNARLPLYFLVAASCPQPVVENSINFPPPTPENPPHRNYSYGDHVSIRCQECHKPIEGHVNLTCLQGGVWDGSPPICECQSHIQMSICVGITSYLDNVMPKLYVMYVQTVSPIQTLVQFPYMEVSLQHC